MGVKQITLLDDGGGSTLEPNPFYNGKNVIDMFLERDIIPIVRFYASPWAKFDARFEDYATVTVESQGESIVLSVRGQDVEVVLYDGVGTLEITATAPTIEPIVIRAKEPLVYGFAQVEVEAI